MTTSEPVLTGPIAWAIAALLAGCSSPTVAVPAEQVCASTGAFQAAVDDFTELVASGASASEVQVAREEVQRTFKDVMEERGDVSEDQMEPLNKAVGEFQTAIDEVPDDAALSRDAAALQEELTRVDTAGDEYLAELGCV